MAQIEKRVGRRIAEQRKLAGLTQARLAEQIGVEPETISRLETGASMPSLARLAAAAATLEIDLQDLFRLRASDNLVDVAIDRLVWLVSRRAVEEIDLVTDLAARVFAHKREEAERVAVAKDARDGK
jgi:transcriptional regulator with XRE-family HTH domain